MVKGITRQVILVRSPDPKLFEEAIFIVKEEALAREGVSADQVLRQARQSPGWPVPAGGRQAPCWPLGSGALGCSYSEKAGAQSERADHKSV